MLLLGTRKAQILSGLFLLLPGAFLGRLSSSESHVLRRPYSLRWLRVLGSGSLRLCKKTNACRWPGAPRGGGGFVPPPAGRNQDPGGRSRLGQGRALPFRRPPRQKAGRSRAVSWSGRLPYSIGIRNASHVPPLKPKTNAGPIHPDPSPWNNAFLGQISPRQDTCSQHKRLSLRSAKRRIASRGSGRCFSPLA